MPDWTNAATKLTITRLDEFIFDRPEPRKIKLITKGPLELDNGAIYRGQWTKNGLREGRGIQVWKDG